MQFDGVVCSGDNTYLCAVTDVNTLQGVATLRSLIKKVLAPEAKESSYAGTAQSVASQSETPITFVNNRDIVHITLCRLIENPKPDLLRDWFEFTTQLNHSLQANPIELEFDTLYVGSAYDFTDQNSPDFIKRDVQGN